MSRLIIAALTIFFAHMVKADVTCPTDSIQPFVGQWLGQALFVPYNGVQIQSRTRDSFAVIDCQSFTVTVNYLDNAGKATRVLALKASARKTGLFTVSGTITEGSTISKMVGSFRQIQDGTLLGTFSGAIGGQTADLTELMNLASLPNGETQLVRTIQMFSDQRGGPYIGSRIVYEERN